MNLSNSTRTLNFRSNILASSALVAASIFPIAAAKAAPEGGLVVGGSATIKVTGANTRIDQTTSRAAIDWQSFSVGRNENVTFYVPQAGATLNRVVGMEPSLIQGSVSSNGSLYFVNPNGLVFDVGSQIHAQNFVATTSNIDPAKFVAGGQVVLEKSAKNARISLNGTIQVADRGLVGIFAPQVINQGTISANLGTVMLAGVQSSVINFAGDGLFNFELGSTESRAGEKLLASNDGVINVGSGVVTLTAEGADDLFNAVVRNSGAINATSLSAKGGVVTLKANSGDIVESGSIEASGVTGGGSVMVWAMGNTDFTGDIKAEALAATQASNGGAVEVSGLKHLRFGGTVSTLSHNGGRMGSLLLDPTDIVIVATAPADNTVTNIAATGNNFTSDGTTKNSYILTTALKNALATSNVTIDATTTGAGGGTGSITVSDDISWDGTGNLTLKSSGAMAINANITSTDATIRNLTLISGGTITQTATKVITVKDLNVTANGAIALDGSNVFTNLTGLTQSLATGNITIKNTGVMNVTGAVTWSGSGNLTLDAGGALNINANITSTNATPANLVLKSGAAITQASTGSIIKVTDLTVTAADLVNLIGNDGANANEISNLAGFTQTGSTGNFSLTTKNTLTVTGSVLNGRVIGANFVESGDVTLTALGGASIKIANGTGEIKAANINLTGDYVNIEGKLTSSEETNLTSIGTQAMVFNQTGKAANSVSITAGTLNINSASFVNLNQGTITVSGGLIITAFGQVSADTAINGVNGAATITAGSLTANVSAHPTNTNFKGDLVLTNAANSISALGNITANNINILNTHALALEGDLKTTSKNASNVNNGTIYINGASFTLGGNVTLTAATTTLETAGAFTTGNTNKLISANGQVNILAGSFSLSTIANYKSIDVGGGSIRTAMGDGDRSFNSDIIINNQFWTDNYAGYRTGKALNTADLTHVQGNYSGARFNITAKAIELNSSTASITNNQSPTITLTSTVGAIATKNALTRLSGNVTLNSATTIDILSTANLAVDGLDSKLTLNSQGDINVKGLSVAYLTGSSVNGSVNLASVGSSSPLATGPTTNTGFQVLRIGNLTAAKNIEVRSTKILSLEGNLTANNGAGNIYISTRGATDSNRTIRLGANITSNGRTSFDLGGSFSGGTGTTGTFSNQGFIANTNYTLNTNNNDLAIIAKFITLNNPDANTKAINVGTGSVYTGSLGGNITASSALTINANVTIDQGNLPVTTPSATDFLANNYIYDYDGVDLSQVQITTNITATKVTNAAQDITITAPTINAIQLFNYKVGNDVFTSTQNARNITLIATNAEAGAVTVGAAVSTTGNLTLQAQTGGIAINAPITVSGTLNLVAGADVSSNSVITANRLTAILTNSPGKTANLNLNGANLITSLGEISATSISITNAKDLNLNGNLTTRNFTSQGVSTAGTGSIIISTSEKNITLTSSVTTNATTTLFSLGNVTNGGTFATGNFVYSSTDNQNVTIVAKTITFGTAAKSINIGLGVLSTTSGGGIRNFYGDITVTNDFITVNGLNAVTGVSLSDNDKTHIQAGEYVSQASPVVINSTGAITVDGLTYNDGFDFTVRGKSIVMGAANNGTANSFNRNLTLNSDTTITINKNLTLSDGVNATLTMTSGGDILSSGAITAKLLTATATNKPGSTAKVNLTNNGNQITKLGAITGTGIDIANGIDLILMGDLKTISKSQANPTAPIITTTGAGSVKIATNNHNLSLGADVAIYGSDNALVLSDAGGTGVFGNAGFVLSVKNNQNLKILAGSFNLVAPNSSPVTPKPTFAIDLGTGLLSTFDAGVNINVGDAGKTTYFGDGGFGFALGVDPDDQFQTNTSVGGGINDILKFENQRVGATVTTPNLVRQATDAATKLAALKTNVIHVLGGCWI